MKQLILFFILLSVFSCQKNSFVKLKGTAFGTTYHITLKDSLHQFNNSTIDSLVNSVNKELSTYIKDSDISKINKGDTTIIVGQKFKEVFKKSKRIYKETEGVFDPTIGVLVNAWDFGPERKIKNLDSLKVKQLMTYVGFDKVLIKDDRIIKLHPKTYFDFNAIAKGYGVDIIGRFFEQKNIQNYLIEIGGEIRAKGNNASKKDWTIGIDDPNFDQTSTQSKSIQLHNESMATSGTYRKFKIDTNGNRYAHILNAKTGYPAKSDVLSASVISKLDCADVDGYATLLVALGLEKSKVFLQHHTELKAFLIYSDSVGNLKTYQTENID
jgi:thiamine biosynthesis lipoprotein